MGDDRNTKPLRVFLWIVPRVNSTAMTKCLSFMDDTVVWMEPYMTCRLNETMYNPDFKKGDPAAEKMRENFARLNKMEEVITFMTEMDRKAKEHDNIFEQEVFLFPWVKTQLEADEPGKKYIFIKDQACAINEHLESLPENVPTRHCFLIRHPGEVYPSLKNMAAHSSNPLGKPVPWDECHAANELPYLPVEDLFKIQYELWKYVKEHLDPDTIILDGHDLASNPDVMLPKFLEKLGVPYKESYLQWPGDEELVFSSWKGSVQTVIMAAQMIATSRAVQSTQFDPPRNKRGFSKPEWKITDELKQFVEKSLPYYEEMFANRLI
ncbi:hypothetical protein HOLleu_15680 [Holothuria leucospilota]|uniref:Sulfotransferase n=1 Tax=Holothuria leucospilota TaxID=206669 RepID=A0A9Q1C326_HOLLE|nr:hypothetical protein HOLleu_15680 [Holothuria leucospilota]